jgi:bifunctional purine biosynthesis protein ade10
LSDTCDETCAKLIKREVSDGVIAPDFTDAALEVLKQKKNGNYLILKVNEKFRAPEVETKQVFGVTFEQKHNDIKIDKTCLNDVVTEIKDIPEDAKDDLVIALITLKYTQSNSVAYAADGQTIGVGAGQQSRVHCTRLAGSKADNWHLRQSEKVLNLPFKEGIKRPNKDNFIDRYIAMEDTPEARGDFDWEELFSEKPEVFTVEEKRQILDAITGVSVASDAFFPFSDNIDRAHESGVSYIAQPGGSTRDDLVIDSCNKYGIAMAFTGFRLFHH